MNQGVPAAFNFENYRIKSFAFDETPQEFKSFPLQIEFAPRGIYDESAGVMDVDLGIVVSRADAETKEAIHRFISVEIAATFKFKDAASLEELPSYFYRNSIAIIFPYLRSFVTTATAIANIKPLILPLMNLVGLEDEFKKNITVINTASKKKAKKAALPLMPKAAKKVAKKKTN